MPRSSTIDRLPGSGTISGSLDDISSDTAQTDVLPKIRDPEQHLSPSTTVGLGRRAVRLALFPPTDRSEFTLEEDRKDAVKEARAQLAGLSRKQIRSLGKVWSADSPPHELREQLGYEGRSGRSLIKRLIAQDKYGFYKVADTDFLSFLEWHNQTLADRQRELDLKSDQYKEDYISRFHEAVEQDWVRPDVEENLRRVKEARLVVDDGLKTVLKEQSGHVQGYTKREVVVLSPTLEENATTVDHELTHVAEGTDKDTEGKKHSLYGLDRIFGTGKAGRAIGEAAVEHFTSSINKGKVEATKPTHRKRKNATYEDNRWLLHGLSQFGVKQIDIRLFMDALFENRENSADKENSIGDLEAELEEAFPFTDIVEEIKNFDTTQNMKDFQVFEKYAKRLRRRTRMYKLGRFVMGKR